MKTSLILKILGALLLIAVLPLPYSYYLFLRLAVFVGCVYIICADDQYKRHETVFFIMGIVYNPFLGISLTKMIWVVINLASAAFLLIIKPDNKTNKMQKDINEQ